MGLGVRFSNFGFRSSNSGFRVSGLGYVDLGRPLVHARLGGQPAQAAVVGHGQEGAADGMRTVQEHRHRLHLVWALGLTIHFPSFLIYHHHHHHDHYCYIIIISIIVVIINIIIIIVIMIIIIINVIYQ